MSSCTSIPLEPRMSAHVSLHVQTDRGHAFGQTFANREPERQYLLLDFQPRSRPCRRTHVDSLGLQYVLPLISSQMRIRYTYMGECPKWPSVTNLVGWQIRIHTDIPGQPCYFIYYARHLQFDMFSLHQNNGPFEVTFPENLQTLTLGHHFNRDLTDVDFPSHLRSLTLGQRFTWSLHQVNLPNSLCNLFCQNLLVSCDWTSKRAAMGLFESISSNPQQQNAKTKQMQTCHWSLGLKFSTHRIHGCLVYLPTFTREINPNEGTYIYQSHGSWYLIWVKKQPRIQLLRNCFHLCAWLWGEKLDEMHSKIFDPPALCFFLQRCPKKKRCWRMWTLKIHVVWGIYHLMFC